MAWSFGDGFDLYAANLDAYQNYWDSGTGVVTFPAGRFSGSRALQAGPSATVILAKSSGQNDAVHHLVVAFRQSTPLTGTDLCTYLQLLDGTTGQVCVVFRSDGAILLTSGTYNGTTLATYTGAFPFSNTWYAFEFEIIINNTAGRFRVRRNGNPSDDFDSGAVLNTRPGTNSYANKLQVAVNSTVDTQQIDDLFWRSDASSVAWMGDIRCYTRMPASDASVQFSKAPTSFVLTPFTLSSTNGVVNGRAYYAPFTATYDGTISTASVTMGAGYTGNLKTSMFASLGGVPTTVLGSANVVTNPATGANIITFGTPIAVTRGTQYWLGFDSDTSSGTFNVSGGAPGWLNSSTPYASFPIASPTSLSANAAVIFSVTIAPTTNYQMVNEPQEDGLTSYVYDSTVNDADFYNIGTIASTPLTTIAVTTRGYMQKSDAGSRTAAVQIKSGSTTVASPTLTLTTSGWQWAWRTDTVDPNTSAAWTASAVNAVNVGPKVVS